MASLLVAQGLRKQYGAAVVLDDFSTEVEEGTVHGLLGPNGSGKTTCLHLLTGLTAATSGTVAICGISVGDKASRRVFGFAPDDLPMPTSLTGDEYLRWMDRLRGRNDLPRARRVAEAFGLDADLSRPIGEYSHGMRRKIQIVAATMHGPTVLFLDEPFRGLDPAAAAGLLACIHAFRMEGGAVIIATHDLIRAERDCDTVSILDHGAVIADGAPSDLMRASGCATLEQLFLKLTGVTDEALAATAQTISNVLRSDECVQ